MQVLAITGIGLSAYNNAGKLDAAVDALKNGNPQTAFSLSLSLGSAQSQNQQRSDSDRVLVSSVLASGDVNFTAAGGGGNSDLLIRGSDVIGLAAVTFKADDAIQLEAAANTASQHSSNKSSSASIGISQGANTGITVSATGAKGASDGAETTWSNSHVHAGNTLSLESGGDTLLKGATASGRQVVAEVGGSLGIESLQDTATFDSQQKNWGFSLTLGPSPGVSISAGKSNAAGDYASVTEQSGLYAGDEGFAVKVQGHTDLNGGVVASSQTAVEQNKNHFETGTLVTRDIENLSVAEAKSSGFSLSSDMFTQGKYVLAKGVLGNLLDNASESDTSQGTTRSAIAGGAVVLTDADKQMSLTRQTAGQTVAVLNRDVQTSQQAAKYQDAQAMLEKVEAHRTIKQAVYKESVKFSDEAYRVAMLEKAEMRKVLRRKNGEVMLGGGW